MKNTVSQLPITNQLLKILDRERPSKPSIQSISQQPANLYSIIKQMYNSFKKDNQSRILQNKIYQLKIHDHKNTKYTKATPVTLQSLCHHHSKNNDSQNISNLILLKTYLPSQLQKQLILIISKQILKINDLPIILKSFKSILKTKQCLNDKNGLYKNIQNQMMAKLLSFTLQFTQNQIKLICHFLLSLPYLQIQILQFIGKLYDKVSDISDFSNMKIIFTNIYMKIQEQTNNNNKIKDILLKSLMKITISEHIDKIKQLLNKIHIKNNNKTTLADSDYKLLILLQKQAIQKIIADYNYKKQILLKQQNMKQKHQKMVDFIFLALESEALINTQNYITNPKQNKQNTVLIKQSHKFWNYFIAWHQQSIKFPVWKQYISLKMTTLVQKLFQSPKSVIQVMKILLKTQGGINKQQIKSSQLPKLQDYTFTKLQNINESVSNYFIRQLLSSLSIYNKYINNKYAKQLIALGLMKDQLQIYQNIILNPNNLTYIDIIIQIFQLPNCVEYFKKILANNNKKTILQVYLITLLAQKPKKFMDFFIKIDSYNKGEIFQLQQYYLLRFFQQYISNQLVIAFLRSMTNYSPSKFSIQIMNKFIIKFKGKPQQKIVYYQAVRSLHIILSTRDAEQLPVQFKKHLKDIVASSVISAEEVFKNVPQKMTSDLTKFYNSAEAK